MGIVTGMSGPLTKGSSSLSMSENPWSSFGVVRVPSLHLGEASNAMISVLFRAISFTHGCGLVVFLLGACSLFLAGILGLHLAA